MPDCARAQAGVPEECERRRALRHHCHCILTAAGVLRLSEPRPPELREVRRFVPCHTAKTPRAEPTKVGTEKVVGHRVTRTLAMLAPFRNIKYKIIIIANAVKTQQNTWVSCTQPGGDPREP